MKPRKSYEAVAPVVVSTAPMPEKDGAVVYVENNPTGVTRIDLTKWLGQGIDEWVWACAAQLRVFLHGRGVTPVTIVCYGKIGLPSFFKFLTCGGAACQPAVLDRRHLEQFVEWLGDQTQLQKSSQKNRYSAVKPVLIGLQARGLIPGDRSIFPSNPFPGSNARKQGETSLSPAERVRFASALRGDIVAIHKGKFMGTESEALTVHALALAMRTGLNTTSLLELRRDSLRPHPFMPTMMLLESFKRRGNATHLNTLRYSVSNEQPMSVPMDGVALFRMVLERTKALADGAQGELRDRVWLYRSEAVNGAGRLTTMSVGQFLTNTGAIVNRHGLRADDGERLQINASRLRKTMENRLWLLSSGDIFAVAAIMGHTPEVADSNYLACTNEMRQNATFVGEALPDIYRGNDIGECGEVKVIPIRPPGNTPVGSCKDSLFGDLAPKDGTNHCSDFFSCFSCRSYAIVGSPKDLHRLFSFYWFVNAERENSRSREWTEQFIATMNLIDAFTQDKFDAAMVAEAMKTAQIAPIKFWKTYQLQYEGLEENGAK